MQYKITYYYNKLYGWIIDVIDMYNKDKLVERLYYGMTKKDKQQCENFAIKLLKQYNR